MSAEGFAGRIEALDVIAEARTRESALERES
jgi:hypothetical protein